MNFLRFSSLRFLAIICITLVFTVGCGSKKPTLRIFTWSAFFDPTVVREFEKEYNCQVLMDVFDSNELMYAKLKSGRGGYDLITPSVYIAYVMAEQKMILPFDWSKLDQLCTLDPAYCRVNDYQPYFVPYLLTATGIGYLKSRVKFDKPRWDLLTRKDLKWRTTLLNDFREVLGMGLLHLGYNPNFCTKGELDKAVELLTLWKKSVAKFENEQYKLGLDCGEFLAVHAYGGDIAQLMQNNPDVGFCLPEEGFMVSVDVFCLYQDCRSSDLAHAFVNFMHRPTIAARNTTHTCFLCPNTSSYPLMPEHIRNNKAIFVPPKDMKRSHVLLDLGEENVFFLEAWDKLRSN